MMQKSTKEMQNQLNNKNNYTINFKRMSIQINLDGLSFCIFNPALGCIESIYRLLVNFSNPPEMVEKEIKDFIHSEQDLRQDFDTIKVIHNNHLFAFVPKKIFSTQNMDKYLHFNIEKYQNEIISHEEITNINAVNVYIPNTLAGNILRENYGLFEYQHFTTILFQVLFTHNQLKKDAVYAHFEKQTFHLAIFKDKKMALFNRFDFDTELDMLYFLLFSLEQLDIETEKTPIYLLGDIIRNSNRFRLIYNYIRYIYFLPPQKNNPFCQNMDVILARQNFILTHSF